MLDGKRGTAQRILYSAFDLVEQRSGRDALEVFEEAINNIIRSKSSSCGWFKLPSTS